MTSYSGCSSYCDESSRVYVKHSHRVPWSAAIVVLAALGCGDGRVDVYPVTGKVTVQGKPAAGASVVFFAKDAKLRGPGTPTPQGKTDEAGVFNLDSFETGDGAPAGEYQVAISWMETVAPSEDPEMPNERDQLQGRYANPEQSGLTASVTEGDNEIPPFELK